MEYKAEETVKPT